jgi:hypothetical protein
LASYRTSHMQRDRLERAKDKVEIAAIVFTAAWAAWGFAYKEYWVPEHRPPVVVVEASVAAVRLAPDRAVLQLSATIKNVGTKSATILGLWYNAYSTLIAPAPISEFIERAQILIDVDGFKAPSPAYRGFARAKPTLEASGRLLGTGWWLHSGESMTFSEPIIVSRLNDFVTVELKARTASKSKPVEIAWKATDAGLDDQCTIHVGDQLEVFNKDNPRHQQLRDELGLSLTKASTFVSLNNQPQDRAPPPSTSGSRRTRRHN